MNGAMAQTPVGDNDLANAYATQTITGRIAVHDPSIVMDVTGSTTKPKYYIYGSHLGRAKTYASGNYQIWKTFKTGEENAGTSNSLFADVNGKLVNFKDAYSTQLVKKVKNNKGEEVDFPNFDAHAWQAKGNNVKGMQWALRRHLQQDHEEMVYVYESEWRQLVLYHRVLYIQRPRGPWIYQGTSGMLRLFGKICPQWFRSLR